MVRLSLVKLEVSYLWPVTISLLALATSSLLILGCWAGAWRLQLANNKRRMEYRWNTRFLWCFLLSQGTSIFVLTISSSLLPSPSTITRTWDRKSCSEATHGDRFNLVAFVLFLTNCLHRLRVIQHGPFLELKHRLYTLLVNRLS